MTVPAFRQLRHAISLLNNFCIFYYFALQYISLTFIMPVHNQNISSSIFVHFYRASACKAIQSAISAIYQFRPSVCLSVRRVLVFLFYDYCDRLHEKPALVTNTCCFKRRSILLCNRRRYAFQFFLPIAYQPQIKSTAPVDARSVCDSWLSCHIFLLKSVLFTFHCCMFIMRSARHFGVCSLSLTMSYCVLCCLVSCLYTWHYTL